MKKVLLTGSTGLIGKEAIQPLLDAGFEVFTLTREQNKKDSSSSSSAPYTEIHADLFDYSQIKNVFQKIKPEYLLHFAWVASGDYLTSEINYKLVEAGMNLLKEFRNNGGKRAVFAGTCFEYKFKDELLKETHELNPTTVYAKCKNDLRQKAQDFSAQNQISFGWGRIFYVFGHRENEKRLTAHVINSLKENKEVLITAGPLLRDYMYTKDIAGAFVKFLDSEIDGCVNICTGKPVSIKEYAKLIASKLGKESLLTFEDKIEGQPELIAGDNTRLTEEVGYKIKYSLDEALTEILK